MKDEKRKGATSLEHMWRKREILQHDINRLIKGYDLTQTEADIYFYLAAQAGSISIIVNHKYFSNQSLSTIKRAIVRLKMLSLIETFSDNNDARIIWLKSVRV
jgi:DNA-binding MarR family transcriptional regulator